MARTTKRTRCRWATVEVLEDEKRSVEISSEVFRRSTTGHYCVTCGRKDTLWDGEDGARLCTHCGTLTRFADQTPEPAADHWLVILRQLQKVTAT